MKLPASIERQVEEADRLQKEYLEGKPEEGEVVVPPETEPEEEVVISPEEDATPPEKEGQEETVDQWKHKYATLQGMYKAGIQKEVEKTTGSLRQELTRQQQLIGSLNEVIATLQAEREKIKPVKPEEKKPSSTMLNEDDFEDYGEGVKGMARTVNQLMEENQGLRAQLGGIGKSVQDIGTTIQQDSMQRFLGELGGHAQNWQTLNTDSGFNDWLDVPAELAELEAGDVFGKTRRELLEAAFTVKNAKRVAKFFNRYQPSSNGVPKKKGLESQVMPEGAGGGPGKPIEKTASVTSDQLKKAGDDYVQGKITEEQFNKISDVYQASLKAGRAR